MDNGIWLKTVCTKNHFNISDQKILLIEKYCNELLSWNQKVNLISRVSEELLWSRHIVGSISFLFRFQLEAKSSVLDLGTGGGLPGIPLAIMQPDLRVMLLDSIQKKINAVNDVLSRLPLPNTATICSRAENLSKRKEYQGTFDYIITRAVASIKDIITWGRPLLRASQLEPNDFQAELERTGTIPKGAILLLKGGELAQETEEARRMFKLRGCYQFPITVDGIDPSELSDKKLVIVCP